METFLIFNLMVLWLLMLLVLSVSLRLLRWQHTQQATLARGAGASQAERGALKGKLAPAFTAFLLDGGQRVTEASYLGSQTLFLFLSTSCPHCRTIVPEIERIGARVLSKGGKVACVFAGEAEKTRAYCQELGLTLPVLLAPAETSSFSDDYNRAGSVPAFVAIDPEGIVAHEGVVNRREQAWRALVQEWQVYPMLAQSPALYR
ncbi:MAG TPA: redoxin domain-containing protein [Ktedonosporobacter sp.]|nr:redoxin domain-containing protein [Ktedonosporobacter sp.]